MAFVSKADAKVRSFFEPPKLFRSFFQKVFLKRKFISPTLFSEFQSVPHLSRLRVQRQSFFTLPPNTHNTFLQENYHFLRKLLIHKDVVQHTFLADILHYQAALPYYNIIYSGRLKKHRNKATKLINYRQNVFRTVQKLCQTNIFQ